jgi:hypothetical protein
MICKTNVKIEQGVAPTAITGAPPGDYDDHGERVWTPNIHGNTGNASHVSNGVEEKTIVQLLRETVAEITNGRIPAPSRRGPGFY